MEGGLVTQRLINCRTKWTWPGFTTMFGLENIGSPREECDRCYRKLLKLIMTFLHVVSSWYLNSRSHCWQGNTLHQNTFGISQQDVQGICYGSPEYLRIRFGRLGHLWDVPREFVLSGLDFSVCTINIFEISNSYLILSQGVKTK